MTGLLRGSATLGSSIHIYNGMTDLGKGTAAGFKVRVVLKRRLDLGIIVWDHRT